MHDLGVCERYGLFWNSPNTKTPHILASNGVPNDWRTVLCRIGARDHRGPLHPTDGRVAKSAASGAAQVRRSHAEGPTLCASGGGGVQDAHAHDLDQPQPRHQRHRLGRIQGSGVERVCQAQVFARDFGHANRQRGGGVDAGDCARNEPAATKICDHGAARAGGGVRDPAGAASVPSGDHTQHQLPRQRHTVPPERQAARSLRLGRGRIRVLVGALHPRIRHRAVRARPAVRVQEADHRPLCLRAAPAFRRRQPARGGLRRAHREADCGVARRRQCEWQGGGV